MQRKEYSVLKNGKPFFSTTENELKIDAAAYTEYQVIAIDNTGVESFASEPLTVTDGKFSRIYEVEEHAGKLALALAYNGFSGKGFAEISKTVNLKINIPVTGIEQGLFAIDFRYANGNGPVNTNNKCAIRTLKAGNTFSGTIVFPQRGNEE